MPRSDRSRRRRGGFPFVSIGKPPRPRDDRRLRDFFLIARPPLLALVQGGEWPSRRYSHFVYVTLLPTKGHLRYVGSDSLVTSSNAQTPVGGRRPPLQYLEIQAKQSLELT